MKECLISGRGEGPSLWEYVNVFIWTIGMQTRQSPFVLDSGVLSHLCWEQTGEATQVGVDSHHDPGHSHSRGLLYLVGWVALFMKFRELVCNSSSGSCCGV